MFSNSMTSNVFEKRIILVDLKQLWRIFKICTDTVVHVVNAEFILYEVNAMAVVSYMVIEVAS